METKINLETSPVILYDLTQEESKKMYIALALATYSYLRYPNYSETALLKLLHSDFKKFLIETKSLIQKIPNNHSLHKIVAYFDYHSKKLKQITEKLEKMSEEEA